MVRTEYLYDLFISHADADRSWVEGYLLDALTQAGLRCYSEAAFVPGKPRLLEFERAIQQSQRALLILSPAYLTESFTQFADLLAQSYGLETVSWPIIPLILKPVKLPPRLSMLTALDATDPTRWPQVVERLCAELQRPVPSPAPRPPCPYPGMVPFRAEDARFFYGREDEIQQLLRLLRHHNFLFVIGPSGSGKSSLVFAGLVPRLEERRPGEWLVCSMRPGPDPVESLKEALGGLLSEIPKTHEAFGELVESALAQHPPARCFLLIVDQLEELFTQADKPAQAAFIAALKALRQVECCTLLLAMRADFYPDLMNSDLWPVDTNQRLEIAPLRGETLKRAILYPATDLCVHLEAGLLERLLADAADEPGALPLVQETMVLLWEEMQRRLLPLGAYERLGGDGRSGLAVAIAEKANVAMAHLSDEGKATARRILLRLVQFGEGRADTRRQQPVSALHVAGDDLALFDQTLRHLTDHRLLTLSSKEEDCDRKVDLAHEALISSWSTFRSWLDQRREAEQIRRRLEAKSAEWMRLGRGRGGLLDEAELPEAERWLVSDDAADLGYGEELPELVQASRATIEKSKQEEEAARQRELKQVQALAGEQKRRVTILRWSAILLGVLLVLAVAAALFARNQQNIAQQKANELEIQLMISNSQRLASAAQSQLPDSPETALLLAYEAASYHRSGLSEQVLHQVIRQSLWSPLVLRGSGAIFSPDGQHVLTSGNGETQLWDLNGRFLTYFQGFPAISSRDRENIFSPDGRYVLTAEVDRALLWDLNGQLLITFQDQSDVDAAIFSPDGQYVLTSNSDGTTHLWNIGGHLLATFQGEIGGYWGHGGGFSPDGRYILTTENKETWLWDLTGQRFASFQGSSRGFSPSGHYILTSIGGEMRLWSLDGQLLTVFHNQTDDIWITAVSPDEKYVLTTFGSTVRLWSLAGKPLAVLPGHGGSVASAVFSRDATRILTAASDQTARLWDLTGKELMVMHGATDVEDTTPTTISAVFSPDGRSVLTTFLGRTAQLWDISGQLLATFQGHTGKVSRAAFSPDGQRILTSSSDNTTRIWVPTDQSIVTFRGHTATVRSAVFSPDGENILTASHDGTARLWNLNGQSLVIFQGHTDGVHEAVFSPDGQYVLTASSNDTVLLWTIHGQLLTILQGKIGSFSPDSRNILTSNQGETQLWDLNGQFLASFQCVSAIFGPNGKTVLTADGDKARLWDLNGQLLVTLEGHQGLVTHAVFSPDGQYFLTDSRGTTQLWDAKGRPLATFQGFGAVFSPQGRSILTTLGNYDQKARLWDLNGKNLAAFQGIGEGFSPSGQYVVTYGADTTLWDLLGQRIATFQGFQGGGEIFSADGTRILTTSGNTAQMYAVSVDDLLALVACRVGRGLTQDEIIRFQVPTPLHFDFDKRECPPHFSWQK
jgi:WD40 repeat protein